MNSNMNFTFGDNEYTIKGSCRQRNTKHSPTSHTKDTHTHTTAHTASLINLLEKNTRETYIANVGVPPWHGQ